MTNELLSATVRDALTAGHLAHLTTINRDGSPQASVVWTGLEGDDIVVAHLGSGRKVANISRDPRVTLTMETGGADAIGLAHYLIVHGTARLVAGGAPELLQQLAVVYLGPGVKFPAFDNPPAGNVIHITPTRIGGNGPWGG